VTSHI